MDTYNDNGRAISAILQGKDFTATHDRDAGTHTQACAFRKLHGRHDGALGLLFKAQLMGRGSVRVRGRSAVQVHWCLVYRGLALMGLRPPVIERSETRVPPSPPTRMITDRPPKKKHFVEENKKKEAHR